MVRDRVSLEKVRTFFGAENFLHRPAEFGLGAGEAYHEGFHVQPTSEAETAQPDLRAAFRVDPVPVDVYKFDVGIHAISYPFLRISP